MRARFVFVAAVLGLMAAPLTSHAITLQVNCDQPKSKLPTIGAALQALNGLIGNLAPNTIEVTGACKENITIDGISDLTLTAKNGASITDVSGGTKQVILVTRSHNFSLNGFAIRGGGGPPFPTAILCIASSCYFSGNNVQTQNTVFGVYVTGGALAYFNGDVIEQSSAGLIVNLSGRVVFLGGAIRNNTFAGVELAEDSFLFASGTSIDHNGGPGVQLSDHSTLRLTGATITANNGAGVVLQTASEARFWPLQVGNTISGNMGPGVSIGDQSWANFDTFFSSLPNIVSGNGQPDVSCAGHFSGASNAPTTSGTTNCPP